MLRNYLMCAISLLAFVASKSANANEFTLNNKVLLLSEYYTRGISQTPGLIAPQLLSIINHKSGLYGAFFVSRVEFLDNDQADQEVDIGFGFNKSIGNFYFRTGLIYYVFPNADSPLRYDFVELDLGAGYNFGPLYTELTLKTSPNHFASSGHSRYTRLEAHIPIQEKLRL